jgi:hypothetical protein
MTTPRRRVLRPPRLMEPEPDRNRTVRLQKRRMQLESAQAAFGRWMTKLKRAFHAVEREQTRISRLEREISRLNQP